MRQRTVLPLIAIVCLTQVAFLALYVRFSPQVEEQAASSDKLASGPDASAASSHFPSGDLARIQDLKLEKLHYFYTALNPTMPWYQRDRALKMLFKTERAIALRACLYIVRTEGETSDGDQARLLASAAKMLGAGRYKPAVEALVVCLTCGHDQVRRDSLASLAVLTGHTETAPSGSMGTGQAWRVIRRSYEDWLSRGPTK